MKKNFKKKEILLKIFLLNIFFSCPKTFGAERPNIPPLNLTSSSGLNDPYLSSSLLNRPSQRAIPPAALPQPSQSSSSANVDPYLQTPPAARPVPNTPQQDPYLTGEEIPHASRLDNIASHRASVRDLLRSLPEERTPRTAKPSIKDKQIIKLEMEVDQLRSALENCFAELEEKEEKLKNCKNDLKNCLREKQQERDDYLKSIRPGR